MRIKDIIQQVMPPFVWRLRHRRVVEQVDPIDRACVPRSEHLRLSALPSRTATSTALCGTPVRVNDGRVFSSMVRVVFGDDSLRFTCDRSNPFIIDVGANVGVTVFYWKHLFPDSRVMAIEADPNICALLRENVKPLSNVEVLHGAAWTEEGDLDFALEGSVGGHIGVLSGKTDRISTVRVPCIRLRDLLVERVEFLKMDIEGAELDVLEDCKDRLHLLERIFVEYHSFIDAPQRLSRFLNIFEECGFRVHIRHEMPAEQPFVKVPVVNGKDLRLNVYATREFTRE